MNRRDMIAIDADERRGYVADAKTVILVSIGKDGYPHAVPMWFVVDDDGRIAMTTYARSQKAVNLRRNPQCALLVESGEQYDELKGVLIRGRAEILDDQELCVRVLMAIQTKHYGVLSADVSEVMRAQARKRVVLRITPERVSSWDHRKLGGVY
jgi:PPOX class probable F420-dependent enzyme